MKGILIADAGSTKTSWSFLSQDSPRPLRFESSGLNPMHQSADSLKSILAGIKILLKDNLIDKIFFYGAGCASKEINSKLEKILKECFQAKETYVESDLLGAAIALFGDEEGIACILGTGSNSGLYSSGKIISRIPSLGFILGDEGGGVALGKRLLNAVFKKQLPDSIISKFFFEHDINLQELIIKTYRESNAAAFLASFSPFVLNNLDKVEIHELVMEEFDNFFSKNILPYGNIQNRKIGFVGSIALNYEPVLKKSAEHFGITIDRIVKNPLPSLENYYRQT